MLQPFRRRLLPPAIALVLAGCGDAPVEIVEPDSRAAEAYLTAALDIMQANSINRYVVDWPTLRAGAETRISGATTPVGTYGAIEWALQALGDGHSFFQRPGGQGLTFQVESVVRSSDGPEPATHLLGDGIAYVDVPWFSGGGQESVELASLYHRLIEAVDTIDALGACGWVVDLRGNTGGNMWPMIAGVGPILGEGLAGHFIDPDTVIQAWGYGDGASYFEGAPLVSVPLPYGLLRPDPPVAVLTDGRTASSGEATAIAFRERPDTRSFGVGTWGVSTANRGFGLSDGATIILTVSTMADRTKRMYGGVVEPDQRVVGVKSPTPTEDAVVDTAMAWLRTQPPCLGGVG